MFRHVLLSTTATWRLALQIELRVLHLLQIFRQNDLKLIVAKGEFPLKMRDYFMKEVAERICERRGAEAKTMTLHSFKCR